jgi:hypothetical protein
MMKHTTSNRTNSGLAPRRWRRDPDAERELLALLDGSDAERAREIVPHVARGTFAGCQTAGPTSPESRPEGLHQTCERVVLPVELMNR